MPTVTVATNAEVPDGEGLIQEMTDALHKYVDCPREFVHIHLLQSQTGSWGGDTKQPWCHVRMVLGEGQVAADRRKGLAEAAIGPIQAHTKAGGRVQVLFEEAPLDCLYIASVGNLLSASN